MARGYAKPVPPKSWFQVFWKSGGVFAFIAAVVLVVLTVMSVLSYRDAQRLTVHGASVQAEVKRKWIDDDSDDRDFFVTFAYAVDGRNLRKDVNVGRSYYDRVSVGDQRTIWYWTGGPQLIEYRRGQTREKAVLLQMAAFVAGVAALFALWHYGSKAAEGILARKWGYETTAVVSGWVERKNSGKPTGRGYMIFETAQGLRGESLDHDIRRFRAIGQGGKIKVYVRKGDVWWAGDVGVADIPTSGVPKVDN